MTTVILGPRPPEVEALIEQRRRLGHDRHDEVWEGVYYMTPYAHSRHGRLESEMQFVLRPLVQTRGLTLTAGFNLGVGPDSYRVPDFEVFAEPPDALYVPTALIVGEVLSPEDRTYEKLPYYRDRGVQELFIVDPDDRSISIRRLQGRVSRLIDHSDVLDVAARDLEARVNWP
jgi:Uma2 family endonuclease